MPQPIDLAHSSGAISLFAGAVDASGAFEEHAHGRVEVAVSFGLEGPARWHGAAGRKRTARIRAGHTSVLPAGMPHAGAVERGGEVLVFYLEPRFLRDAVGEALPGRSVELIEACTAEDPFLYELGRSVLARTRDGFTPFAELYVESVALALAAHLLHHYAASGLPLRFSKAGLAPATLRRAVEYVHAHVGGALSVAGMAEAAGLSARHFSRQFKRQTGQTPYQYVLAARLAKAREQLAASDASVSAVALEAGFCDQAHLTRTFREALGTTPGAYRRLHI